MARRLVPIVALLALTACGPKLIPGTQLEDTPETHELLMLLERFRSSLEAKDVKSLVALTAPTFHDESGTPDPEDDLDAAHLDAQLTRRFARLQDIRVELDIRKIDMEKDKKAAKVIYYYTVSFRPGTTAKAERDSDLKQMSLLKLNGDWKISSGI